MEDVADWLRRVRAEVGMSISELQAASGVARTTIYRIEDRKGGADEATILALATGMRVKPPALRQMVVQEGHAPPTPLSLIRRAKASIEGAERLLATSDGTDKAERDAAKAGVAREAKTTPQRRPSRRAGGKGRRD